MGVVIGDWEVAIWVRDVVINCVPGMWTLGVGIGSGRFLLGGRYWCPLPGNNGNLGTVDKEGTFLSCSTTVAINYTIIYYSAKFHAFTII